MADIVHSAWGERIRLRDLSGDSDNIYSLDVTTTQLEKQMIEQGRQLTVSGIAYTSGSGSGTSGSVATLLIRCSSGYSVRANLKVFSERLGNCVLYENPTIVTIGTLLSARSRNRRYGDTPHASFYLGATTSGSPTPLYDQVIGSSTPGFPDPSFGDWHLCENRDYLVTASNTSGSPSDISFAVSFFEIAT